MGSCKGIHNWYEKVIEGKWKWNQMNCDKRLYWDLSGGVFSQSPPVLPCRAKGSMKLDRPLSSPSSSRWSVRKERIMEETSWSRSWYNTLYIWLTGSVIKCIYDTLSYVISHLYDILSYVMSRTYDWLLGEVGVGGDLLIPNGKGGYAVFGDVIGPLSWASLLVKKEDDISGLWEYWSACFSSSMNFFLSASLHGFSCRGAKRQKYKQ